MTRALDILKLMADGHAMTAERASEACDCDLKLAQNTLCFLVERKYIEVETRSKRFLPATHRITARGLVRSTFRPKTKPETAEQRAARRDRWVMSTEEARGILDRQRAEEVANQTVSRAMQRTIPNSVFALGSMS